MTQQELKNKFKTPHDLINWGELSRVLTGSRFTIRKNKIPKKHAPLISEIVKAIEDIFSKYKL